MWCFAVYLALYWCSWEGVTFWRIRYMPACCFSDLSSTRLRRNCLTSASICGHSLARFKAIIRSSEIGCHGVIYPESASQHRGAFTVTFALRWIGRHVACPRCIMHWYTGDTQHWRPRGPVQDIRRRLKSCCRCRGFGRTLVNVAILFSNNQSVRDLQSGLINTNYC